MFFICVGHIILYDSMIMKFMFINIYTWKKESHLTPKVYFGYSHFTKKLILFRTNRRIHEK